MSEVGIPQRDNAVPELTFFEAQYTISSNLVLSIKHGLSRKPRQVWCELLNLTAEYTYAIGDTVVLASEGALVSISFNTTNITVIFAGLPTVLDNTNTQHTITAANWNLIIKAEV